MSLYYSILIVLKFIHCFYQTWLCNTPLEAGIFLDLYIDLFNICIKKVNYFHFIYRSNKCLSLFGWSNKSLLYKGTFMFMIKFISYSLPSCLKYEKGYFTGFTLQYPNRTDRLFAQRCTTVHNTIVGQTFGINPHY